MALTAIDGTYLRAAAHAPGIAVATIATPAFTPGWQDEAVGRMAHVILSRNERAELTLHPAELGPVSIRVDLAADQASLTIVAESAATRSALEQSLPQLRDLLASQGITLGQASVHDGSARRDDARAPAASATKPGRDAAPSAPVVATTWVVRPSNGRVDVFA
jgi:flagellar hook-length control protein FliK